MTDEPDIDLLAAEYVLGTLPADERAAVALRPANDKPFAAAIAAWEKRLAPLADAVTPQEAPSHVWDRIAARIDRLASTPAGTVTDIGVMDRRVRRWRATAIAASALAASLLLFAGYREHTRPEQQKTLVAVLQKDAQSPAFLVSVDLEQKRLTIRAVSAPPHPGKSYELWLVHDDLKTPARSASLARDRSPRCSRSLLPMRPRRSSRRRSLSASSRKEARRPACQPGPCCLRAS